MKKIIVMTLLLAGTAIGTRTRAQLVVTDPTQTAANTVGFMEQLKESMESTMNILNLLDLSQEQLEKAEQAIEFVEKVEMGVRGIQEMMDAIRLIESTIRDVNSSIQYLKYAVSQKWVSINEGTAILRAYTNVLNSLTAVGNAIMTVTTDGMERMTQLERTELLWKNKEKLKEAKEELENFNNGLKTRMNWRYVLDTMRANDLAAKQAELAMALSMGQSNFFDTAGMDESVPVPTAYIMYEVGNAFGEMAQKMETGLKGGTGSAGGWGLKPEKTFSGSAAVKNDISNKFKGLGKLFWAISGLIGILGAVQVYRKYQFGGEDLSKNIAVWGGTSLLLFVIGVIFNI